MLDIHVLTRPHHPVDHHAVCVHQYEASAEFGSPPDIAVAEDPVEAVGDHLDRCQPMTARPLHHPVIHHGHGAVGKKQAEEGADSAVGPVAPSGFEPKISPQVINNSHGWQFSIRGVFRRKFTLPSSLAALVKCIVAQPVPLPSQAIHGSGDIRLRGGSNPYRGAATAV